MKLFFKYIFKYITSIKIIVITIGLGYTINLFYNYKKVYKDLLVSRNNNIALERQNDSILNNNIVFKYTIDELRSSKDSINRKLINTIEKLKLKDKEIKTLSYLSSKASKTDTIVFTDTIFRDNIKLDTTLKDDWYSLNLQLNYPNKVTISPNFKSEKVIIAKEKKVWLVRPKWWICRLFKKKNTIIEVEVVENNPYIINGEHKHIEIIK